MFYKFLNTDEFFKKIFYPVLFSLLSFVFFSPFELSAQTADDLLMPNPIPAARADNADDLTIERGSFPDGGDFRVEKVPVAGGAEIVTIFLKLRGLETSQSATVEEVPLVSILRDTLGDARVDNDRTRYVWTLTYTKPSLAQKFAAAVPFLYSRTTNKNKIGSAPPPAVLDVTPAKKDFWDKVFWGVLKNVVINGLSLPARSSSMQYRVNTQNYRKTAIARALSVLSLYESIEGKKLLSDAEINDIQARLLLSDQFLGSFMQSENLARVRQKNQDETQQNRGRNWDLLRQHAEAQGLYFEPLEMPDGSQTHALVWLSAEDLENHQNKKFDPRFLNIKNPWQDARVSKWEGYTEIRWFDENNRPASEDTPGAQRRTMIPLALYGLDYPKIPTLLIDFRDARNPKKREMSKRVLTDLTDNVLTVSKFGNLPFFVGRTVYDFVTTRRGMDVNQESRAASYSQLKLLIALNDSLDDRFRAEISERAETVSINPLENDLATEIKIARRQYENLMAYAARFDGLPKKIALDRREEMVASKHGAIERAFFTVGKIVTFGRYTHREKDSPEMRVALDHRRRLEFYERFLRETARDSADPKIDGDPLLLKQSLEFIAREGRSAQAKTADAIARVFAISDDEEIRRLALASLYRIDRQAAKKQLISIYGNQTLEGRWRQTSIEYLKLALREKQRISADDVKIIKQLNGEE